MAAHRGSVTVVVAGTVAQQGIGKSFAIEEYFQGIAGLEFADGKHLFAGAPVNGACRLGIIHDLSSIEDYLRSVGFVNNGAADLAPGRKGIVIVFYHT